MGYSTRERLNTLIHDVIRNSMGINDIVMSPHMETTMQELRKFMFANVYYNPVAKHEEGRAMGLLQTLYEYYEKHVDEMPEEYLMLIEEKGEQKERVVCDYISGMTDQYSIQKFTELFVPKSWNV